MPRRTDPQMLLAHMKRWRAGKLSNDEIVLRMAEHGWREPRTLSALKRVIEDDKTPVDRGRGSAINFSGNDRAIYPLVVTGIKRSWGPRQGWKNVAAFDVSHQRGAPGLGDWTQPDIVVLADPARRAYAGEPARLHAVELE